MEKGRTLKERTFLTRFRWVLFITLTLAALAVLSLLSASFADVGFRRIGGSIHAYILAAYGFLAVTTSVLVLVRGRAFWLRSSAANVTSAVRLRSIYLGSALLWLCVLPLC